MKRKNQDPTQTLVPEVAISNYEANSQWGHINGDRKQLNCLITAPARSVHLV